MKLIPVLASLMVFATAAHAYEARFTKGQMAPELDDLLANASSQTGVTFKPSSFLQVEDRNLATSRFQMYVQTVQNIPVKETAVRIWSNLNSGEMILAELHLKEDAVKNAAQMAKAYRQAKFSAAALKSKQLAGSIEKMVASEVSEHSTDSRIISMSFADMWENGDLVRVVKVRGRRGMHEMKVSLLKNKVINKSYQEFPQAERFTSLKANVFPIYEQVESTGEMLSPEVRDLQFIATDIADGGENPFGAMADRRYQEKLYHPILADTAWGRSMGVWSEYSIRREVEELVSGMPRKSNDVASGMLLQGKYATINIHPAVKTEFTGVDFDLKATTQHLISWNIVDGAYEATPVPGFAGKPVTSAEELLNRVPVRLADHNPVKYLNSGVDEVQVYYAVTVLMDALNEMGLTDPEYSTKPFHAFLYDPDIGMKDNAYYTDNTINFTTYNPKSINLARDNSTIWHELGHGIMDRLMGPHLIFGDTKGGYGGLSEGMADFVAQLVVVHQMGSKSFPGKDDFRIINNTGFYLTNEFHDEGEAYGGVMNDMMVDVVAKEGRAGLFRFTDLTLETMRLTRNHPALTARLWFEQMLYADSLGSANREPGQYKKVITQALLARNFAFSNGFKPASMKVTFGDTELTALSVASREKPIEACDASGVASYNLKVTLANNDADFIKFPATVKVEYKKGALQGAIKWIGEENNPQVYTVNSENELLNIPVKASMTCDDINQTEERCKDYAYLQVYNKGESKPVAKKRFYLMIKNNNTDCK